jgi:hypothetical protein
MITLKEDIVYLSLAVQALCWTSAVFSFLIFYTVGRTPWTGDQPVARPLPAQIGQHKQNIRTQPSVPQMGFEPTIPVFERAKTIHALQGFLYKALRLKPTETDM